MKEKVTMITAVLAIIISIAAVTSSFVFRPVATIGENELADNSITSEKIIDGTINDDDISDFGISKIADESITLNDLTIEVLAEMSGVAEILNNSILGSKLTNNSITNRHINKYANIDPAKINGFAWTAENDGSGSGLDADTVDGIEGNQFLRNDISGTLIGDLIVDGTTIVNSVSYSSPRAHYLSISCEAFHPTTEVTEYYNNIHNGGAFVMPGYVGYLVAPLHLPHGATISEFKVFFYDTADENVEVDLIRTNLDDATFSSMVSLSSSGISGRESKTETTIVNPTIDNTEYSYTIFAAWNPGHNQVKVVGAIITYTINEAL